VKILLFTNSLAGGGAERAAATLANAWARRDWEVTVVTLERQSDDFYQLDVRIRRIALNLSGQSRNVVHGLLQNLRRAVALRKVLKQLRPAVALSLMSTPNVLLALAARGLPGLATVGSERDYPPHAPLGAIWTRLRRSMYGRLGAVVVQTHETARWIQSHSSAKRVAVIPNATLWPLPPQPPLISPQSVLPLERKVVLAVGRLAPVKNFGVLIDTFAQLASRHGHWDLVILGEGGERAALEARVRQYGLRNRVFLPGIAGNVGQWYAHAGLYVMTSRSEGFPNTLAEALAHGLPAVSVDCDTGPRDIIRHDIDGLLVPPGDAPALADALERLMGDADLRAAFGARAQDARQRFSIEQITARWEALFSDLVPAQAAKPAIRAPSTSTGEA